jgi:DNA-directed RNA polymerase specialized sigma24 family protein
MKGDYKMSKIYRLKKFDNDEKISFEEWFQYYQENTGIFWAILRQRIRITRYSLEYGSELDDLMQNSLEKVIEKFNKEKTIPELYKHSIFRQAARNAINIHIRQTNLFKGIPAMGIPQEYETESLLEICERISAVLAGEEVEPKKEVYRQTKTGEEKKDYFAGDGERVMVTSDNYLAVDQKIDVKNCLSKEENRIVVLLLQKYTRPEVAKIIKVNERTVYRKIAKIRQKLEAAGLRECAR